MRRLSLWALDLKVPSISQPGLIFLSDIIDRNETLILGMMWTVFWFYHTHGGGYRDLKMEVLDWLKELGFGINLKEYATELSTFSLMTL